MQDAAPTTADTENHVMGPSLVSYVTPKVHPELVNQKQLRHIRVIGAIRRQPPARIAVSERNRLLDFRRPTLTWVGPSEVQLNCFPSRDLVLHYASLIATYLVLCGRDPGIVHPSLPDPAETALFLANSNLRLLGEADVAIIGDVDYLDAFCQGQWQGGLETNSEAGLKSEELDVFRWKKSTSPTGKRVALVGCQEKIWGDMGEHLVRAMCTWSGIKSIIYVAKAGCLSEGYAPNECIATGDVAYLGDQPEPVRWKNPLLPMLDVATTKIGDGPIVTVPTLLHETDKWLRRWASKALWVDCEVAYMARAAVELDVCFGFLHVVSDNLWYKGGEDLTNEESDIVVDKRKKLYEEITRILDAYVSQ